MISLFPNADGDAGLTLDSHFVTIGAKAVQIESLDTYKPPAQPAAG